MHGQTRVHEFWDFVYAFINLKQMSTISNESPQSTADSLVLPHGKTRSVHIETPELSRPCVLGTF